MKVSQLLNCHQKWCKRDWERNGRVCLSEAIYRCYPNPNDGASVRSKLTKILIKMKWWQIKKPLNAVVCFNDDPKTTFKDIQKLLKTAKE